MGCRWVELLGLSGNGAGKGTWGGKAPMLPYGEHQNPGQNTQGVAHEVFALPQEPGLAELGPGRSW